MSTTQPTPEASLDTALVQRAQGGDEAAFGELMRAHYEQVFRLIVGMVRNEQDARELTQDVWVTAWQQLQTFRAEAKLTTWLHTIAVRRAIDHLRKRRRWFDRFLPFASATSEHDVVQFQAVSEPVDPTPHARAELEQHERHARFEQLLAALPPAHRAVL
ncbi:MAG TPA: sigma-70 family RNA polymerase sigma factor, partial [Candidatus Synoicihabitans sp.]|nr:sigma-70 family RNA polymerase sigma factor [Candidatus Synoicihabitans sp.]